MRAIQYTGFGGTEAIRLNEIEEPRPNENELLIKVVATTINPMDMKIRSGYLKEQIPLTFPFVPGLDAAGIVDTVGSKISRFNVGDKVFLTTFGGTYAEYFIAHENQVALIPDNVDLDEAAALAIPLVTAYTFLVEEGKVQKGEKVLVQGAAGSVGAVVVQMAKAMGAYVIGTASGEGIDILHELGADEAIDYKSEDFVNRVKGVDLVIDLVGGETLVKSFGVIKEGGQLLSAVMPPSQALAEEHKITAKFISSTPSYKKLEYGKDLVEKGKIKIHIAKKLKLEDAAQAQELVAAGGLNGKIVLEMQ